MRLVGSNEVKQEVPLAMKPSQEQGFILTWLGTSVLLMVITEFISKCFRKCLKNSAFKDNGDIEYNTDFYVFKA